MASDAAAGGGSSAASGGAGAAPGGAGAEEQPPSSPSASSTPSSPPWVVLYASPPPRLVLTAARVLALKSAACLSYASYIAATKGVFIAASVAPVAAAAGRQGSGVAVFDALTSLSTLLGTYGGLGAGFGVLGVASAIAARGLSRSVLLRLEGRPRGAEDAPAAPSSVLGGPVLPYAEYRITTASLLPSSARAPFTVHAAGLGPTVHGRMASSLQSLTLTTPTSLRPHARRSLLLFPVEPLWTSADLQGLRSLMFGPFFRAADTDPGPPPDGTAIAAGIGEFGAFRAAASGARTAFPAVGGGGDLEGMRAEGVRKALAAAGGKAEVARLR